MSENLINFEEYTEKAKRTLTNDFHVTTGHYTNLRFQLKFFTELADSLDLLKKKLYYNKPLDNDAWDVLNKFKNLASVNPEEVHESFDKSKTELPILIHAVLGIVTEAGELVQNLLEVLNKEKTLEENSINLKEEIGDLMWYLAHLVPFTNSNLKEILDKNIAKLEKRYPEKFTSENAINRDLNEEFKTLS